MTSPRSGRKRVAQGKSAQPWGTRRLSWSAREAGSSSWKHRRILPTSVARFAGLPTRRAALPRAMRYTLSPASRACQPPRRATQSYADLPWATRFRPLRGLASRRAPLTQGCAELALRYTLSPASRACQPPRRANPGPRRLALGYTLSHTAWAPRHRQCVRRAGLQAEVRRRPPTEPSPYRLPPERGTTKLNALHLASPSPVHL